MSSLKCDCTGIVCSSLQIVEVLSG